MPGPENITEELLEDEKSDEVQPPAGEPPAEGEPKVESVEEPAAVPEEKLEKVEAAKPKVDDGDALHEPLEITIPEADRDAIFADWSKAVTEEPQPAIAPRPPPAPVAPPARQPLPADIPADVFNITPQQFMPDGQDFDQSEMYVPGAPSQIAAERARIAQTSRLVSYEREKQEQEQMARAQMESIQSFVEQKRREGVPDAVIQGFIAEITDGRRPISLESLWDAKLIERSQALRKRRQPKSGGEEPPVPVNKASRVTEAPKSQSEIDKEVEETFGPRQSLAI